MVDSGGQYNFGTTDVTRTISLNNDSKRIKDKSTRKIGKYNLGLTEIKIQHLKKLKNIAKNYKTLQQLRAKIEKDMKNKGKGVSQTAAQIAREDINEQDETPSAFKKKKKIKYKDESGKTKETSLASALKDKKHPAHQRAQKIMKQRQVAYKKQKASKEKEHDKERSRQDKATKDAMKDVGKDLDVISKFFTRP